MEGAGLVFLSILFLAANKVDFVNSASATAPAFLWSPHNHGLSHVDNKETVDYRILSPKDLVNSVLFEGGWSNFMCAAEKLGQNMDVALVYVGKKLQSSDISKSVHIDPTLMNLLKTSFTTSNVSMSFPYVDVSDEKNTLENSLVSAFVEGCRNELGIVDITYMESCSVDGKKFKGLQGPQELEDFIVTKMENGVSGKTSLIVYCDDGLRESEGKSLSTLVEFLKKYSATYSVLYASDPYMFSNYHSHLAMRSLVESNTSINSTLCDGVCQLKSSLLEGLFVKMGGHSKAKEPMSWSDENERTFIGILYEYVKAGKLQCSTFTKDQWGKINQEMIEATKFDYGVERLKGKWNRLRIEHRLFSQLLGHTGVTWDPNTNKVNAAEEVWQHFYTMSKTEFKTFRKDGCKNYELLGEIFGGTTATGGLSNASTNPPPSSDDERQLEENFLTKGVHVHVINDDEQISSRASDDTSTNERRRKKHKANNVEKLESCMDKWSSSIEMRNEEAELGVRYLKGKIAKVEGKSPKPNDSQSGASDPYSDMVCMDILNGIDGVSDDVYTKAVKAFDNPNFRMRFVMMPEHRRLPVLERLD